MTSRTSKRGSLEAIEEIPVLFSRLQRAVRRLEEIFPGRRFTLDGHLVGSLAEVIASYMYDLDLFPSSSECHDGRCRKTGINVQVKGTQRNRVAMYMEPEHLIVLKLSEGYAEEVYNGPGAQPWIAAGALAKNGQNKEQGQERFRHRGSLSDQCGCTRTRAKAPTSRRTPKSHLNTEGLEVYSLSQLVVGMSGRRQRLNAQVYRGVFQQASFRCVLLMFSKFFGAANVRWRAVDALPIGDCYSRTSGVQQLCRKL